MKKILFYSLLFVISIVVLDACKTDMKKQIVGKWQVTNFKMLNLDEVTTNLAKQIGIPEEQVENMKNEIKNQWESELKNMYIEFMEDGTADFSDGQSYTWKYDDENNKLIITDQDGVTTDLIINSLKGKKMKCTYSVGDNGTLFNIDMEMEKQ